MAGFEESPVVLEDVSSYIIEEGNEVGSIPSYLHLHEARYDARGWAQPVRGIAGAVEPEDPIFGVDPTRAATANFLRGSILGMRVVETARGTKFLPDLINVILNTDFAPDADDYESRRVVRAETIMLLGDIGLCTPDPNLEITARWEDALCPDLRVQSYLRSGFGFMLHVSHEIIGAEARFLRDAELAAMQREVDSGVEHDWSAGLKELGF